MKEKKLGKDSLALFEYDPLDFFDEAKEILKLEKGKKGEKYALSDQGMIFKKYFEGISKEFLESKYSPLFGKIFSFDDERIASYLDESVIEEFRSGPIWYDRRQIQKGFKEASLYEGLSFLKEFSDYERPDKILLLESPFFDGDEHEYFPMITSEGKLSLSECLCDGCFTKEYPFGKDYHILRVKQRY